MVAHKKKTQEEILQELLDEGVSHTQIANFHTDIYKLVSEGLTLVEALSSYCEDLDIEPRTIKNLIDPVMLHDLTQEVSRNNLLKPSQRVKSIEFE